MYQIKVAFGVQQIYVFREPPQAVLEKRHSANNRIGDSMRLESRSDVVKRVKDGAFLFEMAASLAQRPLPITVKQRLIDRNARS
jgi:hypothetical protein